MQDLSRLLRKRALQGVSASVDESRTLRGASGKHSIPKGGGRKANKERTEIALQLRELTEEEQKTTGRLVHHGTSIEKRKRAQTIWLASQGQRTPELAKQLEACERMVRNRLHRLNEQG